MKIMIPANERGLAIDALTAMEQDCRRPWQPEATEPYAALIDAIRAEPWNAVELSEAAATRLAFAVISYNAYGPTRDSLLERLQDIVKIPKRALSRSQLIAMHGKPVYIPSMREWALVKNVSESRGYGPVPFLKGLDFEYDAAARALLCTKGPQAE